MVPVYCELCMEVNMNTNNLLGRGRSWFWKLVRVPQCARYTIDRYSVVSLDFYEPDACPDLLLDLPFVELSEHIPRDHILLPKSHVVSFPYIFFP